jgi:decaprenyl-phosphate phosphoribosyltransferase
MWLLLDRIINQLLNSWLTQSGGEVMILPFIALARPKQWLKNLMIYFPPLLGGSIFVPGLAGKGILPFVAFCLVSSAGYIINDIMDRQNDTQHSAKRDRPIAAGVIKPAHAICLSIVLIAVGLFVGASVSRIFCLPLLVYLIISIVYSVKLKNYPLVDMFCISAGFLLRLEAGAIVFQVKVSEWLFLSVFFLALFLSTGKRLGEQSLLQNGGEGHRKALHYYPPGFLEATMYMTASTVLVTYSMYVIARQNPLLLATVPLCCFGLLRYLLRVKDGLGGDPTDALLSDKPLLGVSILWAFIVAFSIYLR